MLIAYIGICGLCFASQLIALGTIWFIYQYYESDFGTKSVKFEVCLAVVVAAINAGFFLIGAHLHPDRFSPIAASGCLIGLSYVTHMQDYEWLELSIIWAANIAVLLIMGISLHQLHVIR